MSGIPSGVLYCITHHGIKNEDDSGPCDFVTDDEPCRWVMLVIPDSEVDTSNDRWVLISGGES